MRTTIDLPDGLAEEAKLYAVRQRTTLRSVIVRALERELRDGGGERAGAHLDSSRLPRLPVAGRKRYRMTSEELSAALNEQEAEWHEGAR